jgi:tetratricopeptide (TPR) repeat protein
MKRFWLVLLLVLGGLGYGAYLYKYAPPPTYKVADVKDYVNLQAIEQTLKPGGQIQVINPPIRAVLPGTKWIPQSFNNCGPATTSMILQYFGHTVDQNTTKAALRTNSDDKNVFAYEIRDYLKNDFNLEARIFYNGDLYRIKQLIANGFYLMLEDWLHPNEDIGHVTIIRGYDDERGVLIADDSFIGNGIMYKYDEFDGAQWKPFNRSYMPIYTADKEPLLKAIVGDDWDEQKMYLKAVQKNQRDVEANSDDVYAWFNIGTSQYALKNYAQAREAFEKSQAIGWPKRMLWYQIQPVQTYIELGDYQKALQTAQIGLWANDSFPELHYESARAYKGLGNTEAAKTEALKALNYDANYHPARQLLDSF